MPYCARCGVEVDEGVEACPLCATPIPVLGDEPRPAPPRRYPLPDVTLDPLSPRQLRMTIWAVLSAVLLLASAVLLVVDLVETGGSPGWSVPALGSIALAWTLSTSVLLFFRRPWLVVLVDALPLLGYLALVDLHDGGLDWFLALGLPIGLGAILALEVSAILWSVWGDRGANQLAILLLLLGLLGVGIDVVVCHYRDVQRLSWSFVLLAVLVPLAGFLFVYHYWLRRIPRLRRIFHV